MKNLLLFILLIGWGHYLTAQSLDLKQKVNFPKPSLTQKEALAEIQETTGISFGYNPSQLDPKRHFSLGDGPMSIQKALDKILDPSGLTYKVLENQVIIYLSPRQGKKTGTIQTNSRYIEGQVLDQQSKEPIPFAHIQLKGRGLGTVANQEGAFRMQIPPAYARDSLIISNIAYENSYWPLSRVESPLIIYLQPAILELDQISIQAREEKLKAVDIVREAIAMIPQNYPQEATLLKAYYRELTKTDSLYTKFADAACQIYYAAYQPPADKHSSRRKYFDYSALKLERSGRPLNRPLSCVPHPKDELKVDEARISDDLQRYHSSIFDKSVQLYLASLEGWEIPGGPLRLTSYDHVKQLNFLLGEKKLKKFKFKLEGYSKYNDRYVYLIRFQPKSNLFSKVREVGTLVIDIETSAILKLSYQLKAGKKSPMSTMITSLRLDPKTTKRLGFKKRTLKRKTRLVDYQIEVEYALLNGKAYLKRIQENAAHLDAGDLFPRIKLETRCDLLVQEIQTQSVHRFPPEDVYRSIVTNGLYGYPLSYDAEFWKTYPYVLSDPILSKALGNLEKTHSLEEQFAQKFQPDSTLLPPIARREPDSTFIHQEILIDDYAWLRQKQDSSVINYLEAENNYTRNYMLPWRKTQRQLYYEMVDRVEKRYESIPLKIGDYYYGYRYEEDKAYEIYFRKRDSLNAPEEVILDVNELAAGQNNYNLLDWEISPDHRILAYAENLSGGRDNVVRFKNLLSNQMLPDSLLNVGSMVWADDNQTIFYTRADSSKRDYQVFRHQMGKGQEDQLVYQEDDREFDLSIYKSQTKKHIFLHVGSKEENEVYFLPSKQADGQFQLIEKRSKGHKYFPQEYQDQFFILSNHEFRDFALYQCPIKNPEMARWKNFLSYKSDTLIQSMRIIGDRLALVERVNLVPHIQILNLTNKKKQHIRVDSVDIFQLGIFEPDEGEVDQLKFIYSSPVQPWQIYAYDFDSQEKRLLKSQKVKDYDPRQYQAQRIFAKAPDGTKIPITLIYKKSARRESPQQLHLNAYGAYGISHSLDFQISHLPFLDRGGIMAYAHVRGGKEYGDAWYQEGKLFNKQNTFDDFIACAEHLIDQGYTRKEEMIASGGSAGGLLMGAVMNQRPDLFKVMILDVPFLDVINTMLDPSLPLTTSEYQEWGNPAEAEAFSYIKSYDPYQNIKNQGYPHLLFRSAYHDDQVGFWEAAKTVAKLRKYQPDDQVILYKTDMYAGHQGPSGRYASFKDRSFLDAFLMSLFEPDSQKISKK